jgi:hypothetical protein
VVADDVKTAGKAPRISDFSQKAIKSAVIKEGLTHPLTLYPPALGILGGLAGLLFAYPPLLAVAIGAGVLGLGSGIVNVFLREDAFANRYLKDLNARQAEHEQRVLECLREDLEKSLESPMARPLAKRGIDQFDRCRSKYQNVEDLLEDKLSTSEITYGRYQSAAKQVYLSVLDNLKTAAAVLESANTIDQAYITTRLKELAAKDALSASDKKEVNALSQRLDLLKNQMALVEDLLAGNEEAMTRLEETTSKIATMDTDGRFASTDFETAINYLQELAQSAHQYNTAKPLALEKV